MNLLILHRYPNLQICSRKKTLLVSKRALKNTFLLGTWLTHRPMKIMIVKWKVNKNTVNTILKFKIIHLFTFFHFGKPQKQSSSLNGQVIKRGGGVKGRAIKEKKTFFGTFFSNVPTAIKLEGGGGLGFPYKFLVLSFFEWGKCRGMGWIALLSSPLICPFLKKFLFRKSDRNRAKSWRIRASLSVGDKIRKAEGTINQIIIHLKPKVIHF